ncbi:hypothetical protein GCM10025856_20870 [Methylophaga marina]|uniref:Uncharacterized protein n=1 Tax=Methylophaga marina TaxID=45495 RepID=A0ABP3CX72_9GAMM|nr:hypothetical protein GCM10025856_20870 [Methylophaga marina]
MSTGAAKIGKEKNENIIVAIILFIGELLKGMQPSPDTCPYKHSCGFPSKAHAKFGIIKESDLITYLFSH